MKRFFTFLLFLIPLSLLWAPLPILEEHQSQKYSLLFVALVYLILLAVCLGVSLANRAQQVTWVRGFLFALAMLFIALVGLGAIEHQLLPNELFGRCFLLLSFVSLLTAYLASRDKIAFGGITSCALAIGALLSTELFLRRLPDELLIRSVRSTPPLVAEDQVNIVYKKNGFRGKRPCTSCSEDTVRIVTIGGSSTYGVPMYYAHMTYSENLQRMLNERRPDEQYEVLNAGIAAYGIMQVLVALEEEILQFKPDVVAVMSWFNDSAAGHRWYGMPGISEREAYERVLGLRKLQNLPVYRELRGTRIFSFARHYLLSLRQAVLGKKEAALNNGLPRMTAAEFRWGLEKVVELGEKHDFMPVFVLEPLNRSRNLERGVEVNGYYREIMDLAKQEKILVANTLDDVNQRSGEWLFYDFIHPNIEGHRLVADRLYDTLFSENQTERSAAFWRDRGIDLSLPNAEREPFLQFETEKLIDSNLVIKARAPYLKNADATLDVFLNGRLAQSVQGLAADYRQFNVAFEGLENELPIADIKLRANVRPSDLKALPTIGNTNTTLPAYLDIVSGGRDNGWTSLVRVNGVRHDYSHRGYNVVAIGAESGKVKSTSFFDIMGEPEKNQAFEEYVDSLSRYEEEGELPIVVVVVHTDGRHNLEQTRISKVLKRLGGSGKLPNPFDSYALVGQLGAEPGTVVEQMGQRLIELKLGDEALVKADLMEISEVSLAKKGE